MRDAGLFEMQVQPQQTFVAERLRQSNQAAWVNTLVARQNSGFSETEKTK
jgi:hypothetical protein